MRVNLLPPAMSGHVGEPASATEPEWILRTTLVVSLLGLMILGGFQLGGSAVGPSPGAVAPHSVGRIATAMTELQAATHSLSIGQGPAKGTTMACTSSDSLSASCSSAAPARPRPLISANGTWINLTAKLVGGKTSQPTSRYLASMAYDPHDGYILMFGGSTTTGSSFTAETWTYQNGTWTQLSEPTSPTARYIAQMAYDPADHAVILFSGYDLSTCPNDTWSFSNGSWTQLAASGPPARYRGDMAYDAKDGYMLLTGGSNHQQSVFYKDTWKFENDTWTDLTALVTGTPPGVVRATMVWDAFDQELVLYGGTNSVGTSTMDTWTYSALTWSFVVHSPTPPARNYIQMAYDPQKSAVILYGGSLPSDSGVPFADTWMFQGGNWTKLSPQVSPPGRGYGMIAYYPPGGYLLMFSGYTNTFLIQDTWAYGADAVVWGNATPSALDSGLSTQLKITVVSPLKNLSMYYDSLPAGCTSANATNISCTPTQFGDFDIVAGVNDSNGNNASTNISLTVREDPTVNSISFSPGAVDVGYPITISSNVTGGTLPLTYNWVTLPMGCTNANASSLICTPNATGSFPVQLTVKDRAGISGSGSATVRVNLTPTIQRFSAAPAAIDLGQAIRFYANVTAGTAPYQYNWTNLPVGCSSSNAPTILCTPVATGPFRVQATATDVFNASISGNISFVVNQDMVFGSAAASPTSVDAGVKLTLYANVSYGTSPYSYSFQNAPGGCVPTNAHVSTCTPTQTGTFTVTAKVTDAVGLSVLSRPIHITVVADPVITAFNATPTATDIGKSIALSVTATQGSGFFVYAYTGLPTGCASSNQASLTCTPSVSGHSTVGVTATDTQGKSATANLNLTVGATPSISVSVSPSSVAPGQSVTFTVQASGGVVPFKYQYTGLPAGCASANSATLTCAPSATGTFTVTVTGIDQAAVTAQGSAQLTVKSPTSSSFLGLPLVAGIGIIVVVIVVAIAAAALLMRRRGKSSAPEPAKEPDGPVS